MQKIPDTFCPAKWDELMINFSYNTVYACCKATPLKFEEDYIPIMKSQQKNLLEGIKDPTCKYCWDVESNGGTSFRQQQYLKNFDYNTIEIYKNNQATLKHLEVNLGNSCNLQCIYCTPKHSSKWEEDINFKKYPVFSDRFNYEIVKKNKRINEQNVKFLSNFKNLEVLNINGGEPLINNKFFELLDYVHSDNLSITTNLIVDKQSIDRLLEYTDRFKKIGINCSIDSLDDSTKLLRNGIDIDLFYDNLDYLMSIKNEKIILSIQSLMTNISVIDIEHSSKKFIDIINRSDTMKWRMFHCQQPRIFSFESLPESLRESLIEHFKKLINIDRVSGAEVIIGALKEIRFNKGIFKEFKYFINEWETRKNIKLPNHIKEKLYAPTK